MVMVVVEECARAVVVAVVVQLPAGYGCYGIWSRMHVHVKGRANLEQPVLRGQALVVVDLLRPTAPVTPLRQNRVTLTPRFPIARPLTIFFLFQTKRRAHMVSGKRLYNQTVM